MSPGLMLILLIFFLLAIGTPIAFVLGIPSTAYIVLAGHNLTIIASRMYEGVDKFVLIAIPLFFLLAWYLQPFSFPPVTLWTTI